MNKKSQQGIAFVWLVITGALLVTSVGMVTSRKQAQKGEKSERVIQPQEALQPEEIEKETSEKSEKLAGKIEDLITSGIPMKCTYIGEGFTTTSYLKGSKQYSETKVEGGTTTYTIIKDNCVWNWYQGENQGTILCFEEDFSEVAKKYGNPALIENEHGCVAFSFSDSRFDPPSHINFTNINEAPPRTDEDLLKILPHKERAELERAIKQGKDIQRMLDEIESFPSDFFSPDNLFKGLDEIGKQVQEQIQNSPDLRSLPAEYPGIPSAEYPELPDSYPKMPEPPKTYLNPMADPKFNPMADPKFNPMADPKFNPMYVPGQYTPWSPLGSPPGIPPGLPGQPNVPGLPPGVPGGGGFGGWSR